MRNHTLPQIFLSKMIIASFCGVFILITSSLFANHKFVLNDVEGKEYSILLDCDNVTSGGTIQGDEASFAVPFFDPSIIVNIELPAGGNGELEYLWISTTDDPTLPFAQWSPISSTNSPEFDPPIIFQTTHFMRCARRSECIDYIGESNYVTKTILDCDNVTNGGLITMSQSGDTPFDPEEIVNLVTPSGGSGDLEYLWFGSTVGPPYIQGSLDWFEIPNSNSPNYDPGALTETTYFIRCVRRSDCTEYIGESNIITITMLEDTDCDNVMTGGTIAFNQEGEAPYQADEIINLTFPTGGTGELEYLWFYSTTTDIYIEGSPEWIEIPNSNFSTHDPGTLTETTYFIRCVRRANCEDYFGESNVLTIIVNESADCDNVLNGGMISEDQFSCLPLIPNELIDVISPTGGIGTLEYLWYSSIVGPPFDINNGNWTEIVNSNSPTYTPSFISETTYFIRCVRRLGCQEYLGKSNVIRVTIYPTTTINLQITQDILCAGDATAAIDLDISGGTAPHTVSWNSGIGTIEDPENLMAGTYNVTVIDANNCANTEAIVITEPDPINLSFMVDNTTCPNTFDGVLSVIPMSGVAPYTYLWDDPNAQTTSSASNLVQGTYSVLVADANNCSIEASFDVGTSAQEFVITTTTVDASCGNQGDGSATISIIGQDNYMAIWNDANFTEGNTLSNVSAGTYTVSITNADGCTMTENVTIETSSSDLLVTVNGIGETCSGSSDGSAAVEVVAGVAPYTFQWSDINEQTTMTATALSEGTYTVTVTDALGCFSIGEVTILQGEGISISGTESHVSCNGESDGFIVVNPSNGLAPYSYEWSNVNSTNGTISGLSPGNYIVTVTDALGCSNFAGFEIINPALLEANLSTEDVICPTDVTNITSAVVGGIGTYSYEWSNGEISSDLFNVNIGTYFLTVTDANNCTVIKETTINSTSELTSISFANNISCFGDNNGSASILGIQGVEPYTYVWNNGETTEVISNLSAGTYTVTVTDGSDCSTIENLEIEESVELVVSTQIVEEISLFGAMDGVVEVTVNGGTAPYFYSWSNGETTPQITGLSGGVYTLTITDSNGCSVTTSITLVEPLDLTTDIGNFVWYDVNGDGIQQSYEQGAGGVIVYLISTTNNEIIATQVTNSQGFYLFTNIEAGEYIIEFNLGNLPNDYVFSPQDVSTNDEVDSDVNPNTFQTDLIIISQGQENDLSVDAGISAACNNVNDGGSIGIDQDVCISETPDLITNIALPAGGTGEYEYLWLQSTVPFYTGIGDPNWTAISNSNFPDYQPSVLGQSTYFIRCARSLGCNDFTGESNIVAISILDIPYANIITTPNSVCYNQSNTFEASQAGGGAYYDWDFGEGAIPQIGTTREVNGVSWESSGFKNITLTVTRFGCISIETHTLDATNCFNLTGQFEGLSATVLENRTVSINWQTTTEDNESIFFIESSEEGFEFTTIGTLEGKEGTTLKSYQYEDHNPFLGMNHYRIRQVRGSGIYGVSEIETAIVLPENVPDIMVYPNPVNDKFTVNVIEPQGDFILLELINIQGNVLESQMLDINTTKQDFDISEYPNGIYFVHIYYGNNERILQKIVKE